MAESINVHVERQFKARTEELRATIKEAKALVEALNAALDSIEAKRGPGRPRRDAA